MNVIIIVGTGGDGLDTFNAGQTVVKHGIEGVAQSVAQQIY